MNDSSAHLTAADAAAAVRRGEITAVELVRACLARIEAAEDTVRAWAFFDRDYAMKQAEAADQRRKEGAPLGPLHGVPVGVKDIFDTYDMPTEDGTVLHSGRRPDEDATTVALLRAAGAIIMGKTVTTELAVYAPGKTRNPHDPERTPGGSSSGSAAAVAAHMVPLALGSQTNGSIIRPASYCGVFGFKPSFGKISRHRVLRLSRSLDHVGVFARSVPDIALLAEQLMVHDARDPDMRPEARPPLVQVAAEEPPVSPRLAFVKTPMWDQTEPDTREAFAELTDFLGEQVEEVELSGVFSEAVDWLRTVMEADLARNFAAAYNNGKDQLSDTLREMIERGMTYRAIDYNAALERVQVLNDILDAHFDRYEALITPATPGEAPVGLASTGSPIFCTLWTLCGLPAISVPLLQGTNGLPLGVQLVGAKGDDARLLRTAQWLVGQVARSTSRRRKKRSAPVP